QAFEAWVTIGAPWPGGEQPGARSDAPAHIDYAAGRQWWSFQPLREVAPPSVAHAERVRDPIDAFILARLEAEGLEPAPRADERELVRRVYFDVIGLPPTQEELEAYVAD